MSLPASWDSTKKAIKNGPDRQLDPSTLKHVYADHMWKCGYMVRAYVIDMIWNMYMPVCIQIFLLLLLCWTNCHHWPFTQVNNGTWFNITVYFLRGLQWYISCISPLYLVAKITTNILGWPKSSYRKTWMNFLANPILPFFFSMHYPSKMIKIWI